MVATESRAVRLGDADLGRLRHVCALFNGAADAANVLVPFVVDGLERGDRVIHVVEDPSAYLRRLATRTDTSAALRSGQLEVRGWTDAYLRGGAFSATRMLAYVRHALRESRALGFRATRLIGDMEWARDGLPGVDELITYEAGIAALLARPQTRVVCAYDARRHSPGRVAAVQMEHEAALVQGELRADGTGRGRTPRGRILAAATMLFAENGVAQTGIDTLIEAADVAKATFYRHFPSKDDLVVAWLRASGTHWFDSVRARAEDGAATPHDVIPRLFEAVAEWLEADDFVGCPYLNTSSEISDEAHPATRVIRDHLAEIGSYLEDRVTAAGIRDAARLGRELHALLAGSISLAVANRTSSYAMAARDAAVELLDARRPGLG